MRRPTCPPSSMRRPICLAVAFGLALTAALWLLVAQLDAWATSHPRYVTSAPPRCPLGYVSRWTAEIREQC